ncbi:MAG: response regulator [bacterium]|nr:response regulator [bacterium]
MRSAFLGTLLLATLVAGAVRGQSYHFHTYDETDGLPSSSVSGIAQDGDGAIWMATRNGLVRYDGFRWLPEAVPATMLPGVADVEVGADGRLWILHGKTPLSVSVRVDGAWRLLPPCRQSGADWTARGFAVGGSEGAPAVLAWTPANHLYLFDEERWQLVATAGQRFIIYSAHPLADGFLVATSAGLLRIRTGTPLPTVAAVPGMPPGPAYGMVPDGTDGAVLVAGEHWLSRLDRTGCQVLERDEMIRVKQLSHEVTVATDHVGGIYLGDADGIRYRHPRRGWEILDTRDFAAPGAYDILVDREGLVWIAGLRGVTKIVSRRFTNFDADSGFPDDEVCAVQPLPDGGVLLGHPHGLTRFVGDEVQQVIDTDVGTGRCRTMDIAPDPEGGYWVAAERVGIARYQNNGRLTWHGNPSTPPLPIFALHADDAGKLWVGTVRGLFRVDRDAIVAGTATFELVVEKISVRRIEPAVGGGIWVTTPRLGVLRIRGDEQEWYGGPSSSRLGQAYAVLERDDRVWVGTAGGLARIEGDSLVAETAPRINDMIFGMLADRAGRVWFGTDRGVRCWQDGKLRAWRTTDGLAGNETNRDALAEDASGRIWIGTDRGVSVFDPLHDAQPTVDLPVRFTSVEVDGREVPPAGLLELPANTHEVVFRFTAYAFRDEQHLRFRTRFEPLQSAWTPARIIPDHSLRYTNLPPGLHRLHLQAVDVEGNVSEVLVSPDLRLRPPVWRTPWFVAGVVLAVLALLALLVFAVANRRFAERLGREVADRTAELRASELRYRTESARLTAVLDGITDGVLVVDGNGCILQANPGASRVLGTGRTRLEGRSLPDILPEFVPAEHDSPQPHELVIDRSADGNGARRCLEVRTATYEAPGMTTGARFLVFDDVTDRNELAEERRRAQRLESLGLLAGGIAHDFNNLLMIIMGNASLAADDRDGPDAEHYLVAINEASVRARNLTDQLLTFARGGAPRKELSDLGALVRSVTNLVLSGTNVSADLHLPADLPHTEIDVGQIEQVLSNILINARQAMPRGGLVTVRVTHRQTPVADDLAIEIGDEGPGVPVEDRERVFEPYYSTKDARTGLGLAVAHSVIHRHDGRLTVDEAPGGGARFTVLLPASERQAVPVAAAPRPPRRRSGRILVLDDEAGVREIIERVLVDRGYVCECVADGRTAVESFTGARDRGEPFDAVLLDLIVPGGMGGADTLAHLRTIDPDVRAVVISGYSDGPHLSDPGAHGFAAAVRKPFTGAQLLATLDHVLS